METFEFWTALKITARLWQVGQVMGRVLSGVTLAKAFAFCSYFLCCKSQIKRFGGLQKHAQALDLLAFCPICYEPLLGPLLFCPIAG